VLALPLSMPTGAQPLVKEPRPIAPAAPGGGWDQTARVMQQVLQRTGLATAVAMLVVPWLLRRGWRRPREVADK
jgi:putative tricarboxylic transport membrane protein